MNHLSILWISGLLTCINACSGSNTPPLAKFKAKTTYFGYQFVGGSSPSGVQIILSADRTGCDELDNSKNTVSIQLSGIQPGDYDISPEGPQYLGPDEWSASAVHRPKGERYTLAAGTFSLKSLTVGETASVSGALLVGKLHAYAPIAPFQTLECNSGSEVATECRCESTDGQIVNCVAEEGQGDCCPRQAADHWIVDIDVEARLCPHLCQASSPTDWEMFCGE